MTTSITSSITAGQEKQYIRFIEDVAKKGAELALEQVPMDRAAFQKFVGRGDEFRTKVFKAIVNATRELSMSNQFAGEEVSSDYGYPEGYRVKTIFEQVDILKQSFPNLVTNDEALEELARRPLPLGADGWFAIPLPEKLGSDYNDGFMKVLLAIASKRNFFNHREGKLNQGYLRQSERAIIMWKKISEQEGQHGDILVIPAQFGWWYRGCSVRRAREVMNSSEFGLGAFAVGCMLLTHPEREIQFDQLHIDCAGDEYSPDGDGQFLYTPFFLYEGDGLGFGYGCVDKPDAYDGSASGFLLQ